MSNDSCRLPFAIACFAMWVVGWYSKVDLGKAFSYKGDDSLLKFRRKFIMGCWWIQGPTVWYSLTYPNQWIDYVTLFVTIVFGGGWYHEVRHLRSLLGLHHDIWGPILSFLFNSSHHCGVALCILFDTDANKRLYRLIFVWGWFAHTFGQMTYNFGAYFEKIWLYWKVGPYLYGFWYITKFMPSDEPYLSPSVIVFWFGRWMWSWDDPREHSWRSESYNTLMFLFFATIFLRDSSHVVDSQAADLEIKGSFQ